MSNVVGALRIAMGVDTASVERGVDRASRKFASFERDMQRLSRRMTNIGKNLSLTVTAPFVAFAAKSTQAAMQAREAMGQVDAALASMGDASGRTSSELATLAEHLQSVSTFDKDEILGKVTANLLTFGNISGEVFDQAQLAIVDMATRLNMDLQPATILLGRALNDPVEQLTALSRTGAIAASEAKELKPIFAEMVESGDMMGAQMKLLELINKQVAGSGQAARDAAPGSDTIDKFRKMQETVGELVLAFVEHLEPALNSLLDSFNSLSPQTQKFIVIGLALAAALGPVLIGFGALISIITTILPLLKILAVAVLGISLPMLAIVAAVAAVVAAFVFWDDIKRIVMDTWYAFKDFADSTQAYLINLVKGMVSWFLDPIVNIFDKVGDGINSVVGFFSDAYDEVVGNSIVPDMVDEIGKEFDRLAELMEVGAERGASALEKRMGDMARNIANLLDKLFPEIAEARRLEEALGLIEQSNLTPEQKAEARRRARRMMGPEQDPRQATTRMGQVPPLEIPEIDYGQVDIELPQVLTKAQERIVDWANQIGDDIMKGLQNVLTGRKSIGDFFSDLLRNTLSKAVTTAMRNLEESLFGEDGLGGFIGSLFKGLFGGARADGGPVLAGKSYMVGERGPEMFMPSSNGMIIPNNALKSTGSGMTINVDARGSTDPAVVRAQVQQGILEAAPAIISAAESNTIRNLSRPRLAGGL